jgi:dienelactone hydrolase
MAEAPAIWGDLGPGPYAVGFRTFEKYDNSRTFMPKTDYFGEKIDGIRARPVQACLWYPAKISGDEMSMNYGEYVFPYPSDDRFFEILAGIQNREIQSLFARLRDQNMMLTITNTPFAAVRDAQAADGKFPLVIYHPDLNDIFCNNAVLCEYLASHGYAVLSTSSLGLNSVNTGEDQLTMEFQIRDREFAQSLLRELEFIDFDQLALVGAEAGGFMAVLMQIRNTDVDAVVSIDGWMNQVEKIEFIKNSPMFDAARMDKPFLFIEAGPDSEVNRSLFESLKYSSRTLAHLDSLTADGFSHYPMFSLQLSDEIKAMVAPVRNDYEKVCRLVLSYLNHQFAESPEQGPFEDIAATLIGIEIETFPGQDLPPTPDQFIGIIQNHGAPQAVAIFEKFHKVERDRIFFREAQINVLGYQALNEGRVDDAIALFKLNTTVYPNSSNTWDSLSDGYLAADDRENAIKCMKKVLETIPDDTINNDQLKQQIKEKCERLLSEMEG